MKKKMKNFVYLILFCLYKLNKSELPPARCVVDVPGNFSICLKRTNLHNMLLKGSSNVNEPEVMYKKWCRQRKAKYAMLGKCREKSPVDICDKKFVTMVIDWTPFSLEMMNTIKIMLKRCCGGCAKFCPSRILPSLNKLNPNSIKSADFVFPVLAQSRDQRKYEYHFLPIVDAPSAFLITRQRSKSEITEKVIEACTHLWPFLTICLMLAFISGFLAWMMETPANEGEFPRSFLVGLFEGFWWSFISMTTVGYGDKTPKSYGARLFSVVWILTGITVCSLFTASLTTEITKAIRQKDTEMRGRRIGTLKHRLLDALIIAKHGGQIVEVEHRNPIDGIKSLIRKLEMMEFDGFLIDVQTFHYFNVILQNNAGKGGNYHLTKFRRSEKFYDGEKLSIGMLIKNATDFEYFENYFADNKLHLETCYHLSLNADLKPEKPQKFILIPDNKLFYKLFFIMLCIVGFICIFGFVYELRRKYSSKKIKETTGIVLKNVKAFHP